ncbi:CFC_HP_G0057240.mRNA.1.CDS.1 [Saccharomyces cerevisiae]|nr:CFC_HP_G0057240.mRNA.1.CDS.1 [Saccharomyces cerevisiae]CAI6540874.1 CFC_HP_G0057240.mRNA.1.CDS.1 [Saccharomyces cerevisiae]
MDELTRLDSMINELESRRIKILERVKLYSIDKLTGSKWKKKDHLKRRHAQNEEAISSLCDVERSKDTRLKDFYKMPHEKSHDKNRQIISGNI